MFETVFDISQTRVSWTPGLIGGIIVAFLFLIWILRKRLNWSREKRVVAGGLCIACTVIWICLFGFYYLTFHSVIQDFANGSYEVVEGRVEGFRAMPPDGHADEIFRVGDRRFSYSSYSWSPCFAKTSAVGGPIRDGLYVRVGYVDDCIVKLEVAIKDPDQ